MALTIVSSGCGSARKAAYRIDFAGQREFYCAPTGGSNEYVIPKERYREGEEVVLYFTMVATDTNYTFLLDGVGSDVAEEDGRWYACDLRQQHLHGRCDNRRRHAEAQQPDRSGGHSLRL